MDSLRVQLRHPNDLILVTAPDFKAAWATKAFQLRHGLFLADLYH
jgi:hypothetical protein